MTTKKRIGSIKRTIFYSISKITDQAAHIICGLFICGLAYSLSLKIHQTTEFAVFPLLIRHFFSAIIYKTELKVICFSHTVLPCIIMRCVIIRGSLTERIYRKLRGKPVYVDAEVCKLIVCNVLLIFDSWSIFATAGRFKQSDSIKWFKGKLIG
jgi:hypothetical protein